MCIASTEASEAPDQEVWLVPPPAGVKYRTTMVRSRHASRGAERCSAEMFGKSLGKGRRRNKKERIVLFVLFVLRIVAYFDV